MLGGGQISVTLDLSSHVTPTMQREAAEAIDAVFQGQSIRRAVKESAIHRRMVTAARMYF